MSEEIVKNIIEKILDIDYYKVKRDVRERGEYLAVAVYDDMDSFAGGIKQDTWEKNSKVRTSVEKALEKRKEMRHRRALKNSWQVQALLGNWDYIFVKKLLPSDVFYSLGEFQSLIGSL